MIFPIHKFVIAVVLLTTPISYATPEAQESAPHKCYYSLHLPTVYECVICHRDLTQEIENLKQSFGMQSALREPAGAGMMIYAGICASGLMTCGLSLATVATALIAPQYCPTMAKIAATSALISGMIVLYGWRLDKIQQRINSYSKP